MINKIGRKSIASFEILLLVGLSFAAVRILPNEIGMINLKRGVFYTNL